MLRGCPSPAPFIEKRQKISTLAKSPRRLPTYPARRCRKNRIARNRMGSFLEVLIPTTLRGMIRRLGASPTIGRRLFRSLLMKSKS